MLIIFGGLPGVGKSALAKELARQLDAVHLRIDSIEQAIRDSSVAAEPLNDAGYRVAYAIAEDNLRLGWTVIADCVNPIRLTREAWIAVARRAGVVAAEVEVVCSDELRHRKRVESRPAEITGLRLPAWEEVIARDYEPWTRAHIVVDTARKSVAENVEAIRQALPQR